MSAINVPVKKGAPQQISGVTQAGSIIYNTDSSFAVWVKSSQDVRPGSGMLLGPLGTVSWTKTAPVFACLDSAAASTVNLTISDDVSTVDNPIAIAAATAALLLEQGVPSIFRNDVLGVWNSLFGNSIQPGASVSVDIYKYATLTLQVNSNPAGRVSLQMEIHEAPIGGSFDAIIGTETFSVQDTAVSGTFAVPVIGQSAVFTNKGTTPIQLSLYGNNRLLGTPQPINVGGQNMPRQFQSASIPTPASGLVIPLTSIDSGPNSTNFNGNVTVRMFVNASTKPSFLMQMVAYDPVASRALTIVDAAGFHAVDQIATEWDCYMSFNHPVAVVQWQARMSVTSTAPTVRFGMEFISSS